MSSVERSGDENEKPEETAAEEKPGENGDPAEVEAEGEADAEGGDIIVVVDEAEESAEEPDPVAELEAKVKEHYDRLVRTTADFDNFRKRSRRDISDARVEEQSKVLREMLPVVDNLERAIAAAVGDSQEVVAIRKGLDLVLRQFSGALEKFQVARVEAIGQAFDPNLHEAVSQMETGDHPPGTVVAVLQPGYTIGTRLLRAALAVVAKAPAEPAVEVEVVDEDTASNDDDDDEVEIEIDESEASEA